MDSLKVTLFLIYVLIMRQVTLGFLALSEGMGPGFFFDVSGWSIFMVLLVSAIVFPLSYHLLKGRGGWVATGLFSGIAGAIIMYGGIVNSGDTMRMWYSIWIAFVEWIIVGAAARLGTDLSVAGWERFKEREPRKRRAESYWN